MEIEIEIEIEIDIPILTLALHAILWSISTRRSPLTDKWSGG